MVEGMPNRSSKTKRPRDLNQLAASIVAEATGEEAPDFEDDEEPDEPEAEEPTPSEKNPAAVALGRLGGKKGGKARAAQPHARGTPGNRQEGGCKAVGRQGRRLG